MIYLIIKMAWFNTIIIHLLYIYIYKYQIPL